MTRLDAIVQQLYPQNVFFSGRASDAKHVSPGHFAWNMAAELHLEPFIFGCSSELFYAVRRDRCPFPSSPKKMVVGPFEGFQQVTAKGCDLQGIAQCNFGQRRSKASTAVRPISWTSFNVWHLESTISLRMGQWMTMDDNECLMGKKTKLNQLQLIFPFKPPINMWYVDL